MIPKRLKRVLVCVAASIPFVVGALGYALAIYNSLNSKTLKELNNFKETVAESEEYALRMIDDTENAITQRNNNEITSEAYVATLHNIGSDAYLKAYINGDTTLQQQYEALTNEHDKSGAWRIASYAITGTAICLGAGLTSYTITNQVVDAKREKQSGRRELSDD